MPIVKDLLSHFFKREPIVTKAKKIYDFIFDLVVICPYYKIFKSSSVFTFQQVVYHYFLSPHNFTWENERIVEVPIILRVVKENYGKRVLELGNVLSHYFCINHDVVDKYEKANSIINKDIVDFRPDHKYDLIVSISTFEHFGFNEYAGDTKDHNKILDAIKKVKSLLASGGKAVITLPLGYNPELDKLLKEKKTLFNEKYCMKRISRLNSWIEVNWDDVHEATYDKPFRFGNWLLIGVINN